MGSFGRQVLGTIGSSVQLLATEEHHRKPHGVTVDWSTVAAVSGSDYVAEDSVTVSVGKKCLKVGQLLTKITASGKFGPYDPAAADGRQLFVRGDSFLVNRLILEEDVNSDHPDVIDGGVVWFDRLIQSGVGAHSLAAGPTRAELEALFPLLTYHDV